MITIKNINARQVNSDEAIRRRNDQPYSLIDSTTNEMIIDEEGYALVTISGSQEGDT